jgi:outer membrane autotransporter protein
MMGAFAIWNQSQDGLGFQLKLANTYQDKDISTVRDVIGTSEAGRGNTNLNIQSYLAELSYAFNHQDKLVVRPYFALRHTKIKQDAFTESGVDNPLSVAKLNDRALSSLLGAKFNFAMTPRLNFVASVGVEQDLTRKVDQFVATSSNIEGLSPEAFNSNADRTRAVASMGAYYAVQKNQRLSMDVFFQESTFGGKDSTTGYLNYMIGF